jgi:hypothetical protein
MKVRAIKRGYYNHRRIKEGEVFEMENDDYQPKNTDGKPKVYSAGTPRSGQEMVCSWVEPVSGKIKNFEMEEDEEAFSKSATKKRRSNLHQDVI